jgi:hypothetical protein
MISASSTLPARATGEHPAARIGIAPRVALLVAMVLGVAGAAPAGRHNPPSPPPQAAHAGFTEVLFDSEFGHTDLAAQLSCAGTPQTAPWKQGLWWEGWKNPAGVAPCHQISIVYDQGSGQNVLDLKWTASENTDTYHATTVSTFPLDVVSPHFSFRHGYIEAVVRVSTMATGVWPAIWAWGDNALIMESTPPYTSFMSSSEFDVVEGWGGAQPEVGAHLHEWYKPHIAATLFDARPAPFDLTKVHTYGWLWDSNGKQWQGGYVCSYVDNVKKGCAKTTAASEGQSFFLILSMGVGCHYKYRDLSCIGSLSRADMYVSRVTVFGR